jgi:hypothetical protein
MEAAMDEAELIEAFTAGARDGLAGGVSVQGDVLSLDGWWHAALRLDDEVCLVRAEEPPSPTDALERLAEALRRRGLAEVPGEHPLIQAVTYTELSTTGVAWTLWAADAARAHSALAQRTSVPATTAEGGMAPSAADHPAAGDLSAAFAASLQDGFPTPVVLAVGLAEETVEALRAVVPKCRVETEALGAAVEACRASVPHVVVVDASSDDGRRFLLEFRAEACGRHRPGAAITEGELPKGADVTLDAGRTPLAWQSQLVELLP